MPSTTFTDGATLVVSAWLNDVNSVTYSGAVVSGVWTTPTFAAGDYTSDVGSWTVAAGDVQTAAYTILNKQMTMSFNVITSTIATTPNILYILIPASKTATKAMRNVCQVLDNGTRAAAVASVAAGDTKVSIQRMDAANFANATDQTYVLGQITFEIN